MSASEQLPGRVEALNVNEKDEKITPEKDDYVYVNKNMETPQTEAIPDYSPCSETISISTTEKWEKQLMQDPKVSFRPTAHFEWC